jgi:FkbM family methyltransferase
MLYNFNDRYIGRSLELYGEWSQGEIDLLSQHLEPGMVVVEAGANIGAHTVFLAQAVGVSGYVLAFEPQRIVYQTLCANLALNSITNVGCRQAAVGDSAGEVLVPCLDYTRENNFGGLSLGRHESGERVPIETVDAFDLAQCALLKVDVEGMERSVLEGARTTIARCRPILYVENDRKDRSADLIRFIDSLGYDMYWHCPPLFNPDNFTGNSQNVFANIKSRNMFCCPRGAEFHVSGLETVQLQSVPT